MESIKELRQMLQTNVLGHPILQRVLSIYITRLLLSTRVTATQVTVVMFVVGVLGSVAIVFGYVWIGFALLYLSLLLDAVDGEIARYRRISSLRSIYVDLVNHLATQALFFLAIGFWAAQGLPEPLHTAMLMGAALGAFAFPLRRANGDLHKDIYVRPFTDPGLYKLDYVYQPPVSHAAAPAVPKSAFSFRTLLHLPFAALYTLHEFAFMMIAFVVVILTQQFFFPALPLAAWLVILYAATSCLYAVREIFGGFYSIDRRVHGVRDRLEALRLAKTKNNE